MNDCDLRQCSAEARGSHVDFSYRRHLLVLLVFVAPALGLGCGPQTLSPPQPAPQPWAGSPQTEGSSLSLIKVVTDESLPWDDRYDAADKLDSPNVPKVALPALRAALSIKDDRLAVRLAMGVLKIDVDDEEALEVILKRCLRSEDAHTRVYAAQFFGFDPRHPSKVVPALTVALKDPVSWVRLQASQTLGMYRADAAPAVPALIETLGDVDWEVRLHAAQALGDVGRAAKPAIPRIEGMLKAEKNGVVLQYGRIALHKIQSASESQY